MMLARLGSLAIVASLALWPVAECRAADPDLRGDLDTILVEEALAGVAWSLVGENGELRLGATGWRDLPSRTPYTIETRFHVGSLTKAVLATGVLRLVSEGSIELDAPVSRYLPNLSFENPWEEEADVSVRHLLDHTSGLNDAYFWQLFSLRPAPDTPLVAAFPEPATQLRIRARPGSRFSYSNMGYTLLGMIVEAVTGVRYETYLDEHVLAPLGMRESTFAFTTQAGEGADPTLAWGHVDDGSRFAAVPMFLRPAGQFTTTAADLARFAQFLLSDGKLAGDPFMDGQLMRARGRPSTTAAASGGLAAGYALGLGRRDRHGVVGYCHGGNIVGFVAMLCIFPDERKAFAYSVNTDSETADYGRIDSLLINALGIAAASTPTTVEPAPDVSGWHGRYVLRPNRFETFEYLDTVFGAISLSSDGGSLTMTSLQQSPRRLRPVGDRLYSANDRTSTSHVLLRGEAGEVQLSDGFKTFEKVPAAYLIAHWSSVLLGLAGLIWIVVAGVVSVLRYRGNVWPRTITPAFVAIALLPVPIPFFMSQSFMTLGDLTFASVLLAAVTLLLPVGMLMTMLRARKTWRESRLNLIHGVAAAFVLQWCAVLISAGMLPLKLWV